MKVGVSREGPPTKKITDNESARPPQGPELLAVWADLMVAGGRCGHDSRQGEQDEISLGTWQIQLGRAIQNYLQRTIPEAANSIGMTSETG
jgi:hypothetical protein